jgi:hypothetical protein
MIHVNIDWPEANREALVFSLKDIEGVKTGTHYYGYYIMTPMDIHYILDDQSVKHYKAHIFTDNQVLFSLPAWPYSPLYNRDEMLDKIATNVMHAMDDACHAFEENQASCHWKHHLLDFPTGHVMSGKDIYEETGNDEELQLELIPIVYSHATLGSSQNTIHYAAWKVMRSGLAATKRGKIERKNMSKAAFSLENLLNSKAKQEDWIM